MKLKELSNSELGEIVRSSPIWYILLETEKKYEEMERMKEKERWDLFGSAALLVHTEIAPKVDKDFVFSENMSKMPGCYGDYLALNQCVACDFRLPCARKSQGEEE
jgi:hypothetical protein